MVSRNLGVRLSPELAAEIARLAKAYRKPQSEIARLLIEEALEHRAEEMTASQFQLVENRMAYMERRFSGWMVKLARAIAESLYYSEQMATIDLKPKDKKMVQDAAAKYVREFMKTTHEDPNKASKEAGIE
jgi:predicted transcriptional regulator